MIVALLNRKSDVGKTTQALHLAGEWARQRFRVIAIDADRQGRKGKCWLDWSKQRAKEGLTRFFGAFFLAPGAPEIARTLEHMVIEVSPGRETLMRSALLATDVALMPFQPSPSGERALVKIRKLLENARIFRPDLHPRFIANCYGPRALIVLERGKALAKHDPPTPCGRVGQRVAFANVARTSPFAWKPLRHGYATRADDRARCRNHKRRTVTACDRKSLFAVRPSDPETRRRSPDDRAVESAAKAERIAARMTFDVTPELRGHSKVTAFQCGLRVAKTPCGLLAREFPQTQGGRFDG